MHAPFSAQNADILGHILVSLSAISAVLVASIQAGLLFWKRYVLKKHLSLALSSQLPPMEKLERTLFGSLKWGFIFTTATLLTGLVLSRRFSNPKLGIAIFAWALLGGLLLGHRYFGWKGTKTLTLTFLGLLLLLLGYFLSNTLWT